MRGFVEFAIIASLACSAYSRGNTAKAQNEAGVALQRSGDLAGSIRAFRRAAALDSNFAPAVANLGHALREQGDVQAAIECFRRVVALHPKSGEAHADLGHALSRNDLLPEATAELRKA